MLLLGFRKRREGFSVHSRSLSLFFAALEKSGKEVLSSREREEEEEEEEEYIYTHTHREREREKER